MSKPTPCPSECYYHKFKNYEYLQARAYFFRIYRNRLVNEKTQLQISAQLRTIYACSKIHCQNKYLHKKKLCTAMLHSYTKICKVRRLRTLSNYRGNYTRHMYGD